MKTSPLEGRAATKTARDFMSAPVLTLPRTATVLEGARFLLEKRVSGVPVVDANGRPAGVFSLRDLARFFLDPRIGIPGMAPDPSQSLVSEIMTARVVSIRAEATVEDVRRAMRASRIHRLMVVEKGCLIGVVSASDLATRNV